MVNSDLSPFTDTERLEAALLTLAYYVNYSASHIRVGEQQHEYLARLLAEVVEVHDFYLRR